MDSSSQWDMLEAEDELNYPSASIGQQPKLTAEQVRKLIDDASNEGKLRHPPKEPQTQAHFPTSREIIIRTIRTDRETWARHSANPITEQQPTRARSPRKRCRESSGEPVQTCIACFTSGRPICDHESFTGDIDFDQTTQWQRLHPTESNCSPKASAAPSPQVREIGWTLVDGAMDDQNDFDTVQWTRNEESYERTPSRSKSSGKRRQGTGQPHTQHEALPDRNADSVDTAGIGSDGFLDCTVDSPQKEGDGTREAYVSYLITTHVRSFLFNDIHNFKTFAKPDFTVRRRFNDFVYLYQFLFRQYTHVAVPPLPEKQNISYVRGDRFSPDFTQRRANSLHRFIRRIAYHPVLRRNSMFLNFLETPDWNSVMRGRNRESSFSDSGPSGSMIQPGSPPTSTSAFESLQDWSMNLFTKPHKPDKRFIEVRDKANKLDEDLGTVEKVVVRLARRENDLEGDYSDLAVQFQKLVNLESGVADALTSFASSVETTGKSMKKLREATDQDYVTSLRDMSSYVGSVKALLKSREQKQLDFEALTDYLTKAANERDSLASQHGPSSLSSSATSFIRNKIEDVRGVDHEQSRRDRLRKTEMQIERLTREVEESKTVSEAFDDQVVNEVAEFERIKACEFKDTLGALADAEVAFFKETLATWEEFIKVLEARLEQASILKKVVEAIRDLVQDCNFDCNDSGIALQAMDNSHVALVSMLLNSSAFSPFRCDRNLALGINLNSLTKVLRCAQNDDILTIKAEDTLDAVNLVFESSDSDRISEYDIKLIDIDQEHLGIPDTTYAATVTMPSAEFQRICRDLMALSESVAIECTKDGVKFACSGDIGSGSVTLRSQTNVDDEKKNIEIALSEPVALTFSLKYLVNFCKASGLSDSVKLCLSNEVPLLVEYGLTNNSYLRFYLAPKIGDEE